MRRCLREPAPVITHGSPPGVYWYQIGTVSGPRLSPALTDSAAMCGSAKNCSRSSFERAMVARLVAVYDSAIKREFDLRHRVESHALWLLHPARLATRPRRHSCRQALAG